MGFISQYILPKTVDFDTALQKQALLVTKLVSHINTACELNDVTALSHITNDTEQARKLKSQNMQELLDVLILPYDKESLYRMITQLDWIALSIKHFRLEIEVYDLHSLEDYLPIATQLLSMSNLLEEGIALLPQQNLKLISDNIDQILDLYDEVVSSCAQTSAQLLKLDDYIQIIRHKDMILQLKEIAKRIHIAANTLEDMAIKIV